MRVCELPQLWSTRPAPPSQHSAGGSHSSARPASPYTPTRWMCLGMSSARPSSIYSEQTLLFLRGGGGGGIESGGAALQSEVITVLHVLPKRIPTLPHRPPPSTTVRTSCCVDSGSEGAHKRRLEGERVPAARRGSPWPGLAPLLSLVQHAPPCRVPGLPPLEATHTTWRPPTVNTHTGRETDGEAEAAMEARAMRCRAGLAGGSGAAQLAQQDGGCGATGSQCVMWVHRQATRSSKGGSTHPSSGSRYTAVLTCEKPKRKGTRGTPSYAFTNCATALSVSALRPPGGAVCKRPPGAGIGASVGSGAGEGELKCESMRRVAWLYMRGPPGLASPRLSSSLAHLALL
jgi:hypothetical protein